MQYRRFQYTVDTLQYLYIAVSPSG